MSHPDDLAGIVVALKARSATPGSPLPRADFARWISTALPDKPGGPVLRGSAGPSSMLILFPGDDVACVRQLVERVKALARHYSTFRVHGAVACGQVRHESRPGMDFNFSGRPAIEASRLVAKAECGELLLAKALLTKHGARIWNISEEQLDISRVESKHATEEFYAHRCREFFHADDADRERREFDAWFERRAARCDGLRRAATRALQGDGVMLDTFLQLDRVHGRVARRSAEAVVDVMSRMRLDEAIETVWAVKENLGPGQREALFLFEFLADLAPTLVDEETVRRVYRQVRAGRPLVSIDAGAQSMLAIVIAAYGGVRLKFSDKHSRDGTDPAKSVGPRDARAMPAPPLSPGALDSLTRPVGHLDAKLRPHSPYALEVGAILAGRTDIDLGTWSGADWQVLDLAHELELDAKDGNVHYILVERPHDQLVDADVTVAMRRLMESFPALARMLLQTRGEVRRADRTVVWHLEKLWREATA